MASRNPTMVSVGTPVTNIASDLQDGFTKAGDIYSEFHKNKLATEEANRKIREENRAIDQRNFLSQYDPMSRAGVDGFGMDESSLKYAMESEQKARDKHAQDIAAGIQRESAEELESNLLERRRSLVTAEGLGSAIAQDLISNNVDPTLVKGMLDQYTVGLQSREDLLAREKANVKAFNETRDSAAGRLAQIVGYGAQQDNNYASNLRMSAGGSSSTGGAGGKGKSFNIKDYDAYNPDFAEYLEKASPEAWHSFGGKAVRNIQGAARDYRALVNDSYNSRDTAGSKVDGTNHEIFAFLQEHIPKAFLSSRGQQVSVNQMVDLLDEKFTPWKRNKDLQEAAIMQRQGSGQTTTQNSADIPRPRQLYTPNELQWLKQQEYQQVRGWDQIARERVYEAYSDLIGESGTSKSVYEDKKTESSLPREIPTTKEDNNTDKPIKRKEIFDNLDKSSVDALADNATNTASGLILSRDNIKPAQPVPAKEGVKGLVPVPETAVTYTDQEIESMTDQQLAEAAANNFTNIKELEKLFQGGNSALKARLDSLPEEGRKMAYNNIASFTYEQGSKDIPTLLGDTDLLNSSVTTVSTGAERNARKLYDSMYKSLTDQGFSSKEASTILKEGGFYRRDLIRDIIQANQARRRELLKKSKEVEAQNETRRLRSLLDPAQYNLAAELGVETDPSVLLNRLRK